MNLYLYIPPHSAHPPGVLLGLIYGNISRIYNLCSEDNDKKRLIAAFYQRLIARGYKSTQIIPMFQKAADNIFSKRKKPTISNNNHVFFHLPYHPDNPPSKDIRELWNKHLLQPQYRQKLQRSQELNV